ncbi:hypothetical protein KCQ_02995 [Pectobacterium atrosepticum ICMP 1526]|nr:hypothetical protein KCQ_02995 [Pectobacterium atrosepticum ICMP 1526]
MRDFLRLSNASTAFGTVMMTEITGITDFIDLNKKD